MLCHAPATGTLAQPMHVQEGKGRKSRKTCTLMEAAVEDRRGKSITVQGTILIRSSFCSIAHQKGPTERWSRKTEPDGLAAGSCAAIRKILNQRPCTRHKLPKKHISRPFPDQKTVHNSWNL